MRRLRTQALEQLRQKHQLADVGERERERPRGNARIELLFGEDSLLKLHHERPQGISIARWCETTKPGPENERAIRAELGGAKPSTLQALDIRAEGGEAEAADEFLRLAGEHGAADDLDPAAAERDLVHGRSRASIIAVSWLKKRKTRVSGAAKFPAKS